MGNKIESPKIKNIILEISETTEINLTFLKSEFINLFELIGDVKSNKEIQKLFVEILLSLDDESILNFLQNLIDYITITKNGDSLNTASSFCVLKLIIEAIIEKNKNFRELILFSLEKAKLKNFNNASANLDLESEQSEIKNLIRFPFPFNLINICIDNYKEIQPESSENKLDSEILYNITSILSNFLNFNKISSITNRTIVDFLDPYKFFIQYENLIAKDDKISNFINKLIFNFLKNFNLSNSHAENEYFSVENLDIILWFCLDINKFFFVKKFEDSIQSGENFKSEKISYFQTVNTSPESVEHLENNFDSNQTNSIEKIENEYFFENDFNQKVFLFISELFKEDSCYLSNPNYFSPIHFIENCNFKISEIICNAVLVNQKIFKDFVFYLFTNFERLNSRFKLRAKIFLIYLFESNLDICEMICLNRDYIKLILNKLSLQDFYDLLILNKLTLCKNFFICLRSYSKTESEMKLLNLSEKCLETILINRNQNLKLDSISYLLKIILYNMSCFVFEVNQSILLKFGEFIAYFNDVELNSDSFSDNLIIFYIFLEIILNLIFNIEFPGSSLVILMLLKFDEQLNSIYKRYEKFFQTCKIKDGWASYCYVHDKLMSILNKFKSKILEEAANIKFSPNNEISIEKDISRLGIDLKENKIFNTETEKFVIFSLYSNIDKSLIKLSILN